MKEPSTSANGLAASMELLIAAFELVAAELLSVEDAVEEDSESDVVAVAVRVSVALLMVVFLSMVVPVAPALAPVPTAPVPSGTKAVVVTFLAAVRLLMVELMLATATRRLVALALFEFVIVETRDRAVVAGASEPPLKVNIPE